MKKETKKKEDAGLSQPKKRGEATGGDSSRTQKGNPDRKAKGKAEGRK